MKVTFGYRLGTGMGADGREGARMLKASKVQPSGLRMKPVRVVYGMPQAIAAAGLMDAEVTLTDVAARILTELKHG
ncbi:chemotaxis protein CheB [Alishewanella longhuensis]